MRSGDGILRRVHPILAVYIGDYPEQLLVAGVKNGECPKCMISHDELGAINVPVQRRDIANVLMAFKLADSDPGQFLMACDALKLKPVYRPFWQQLPLINIFQSLTPDILHQLYQGMVKHVLSWLRAAYGDGEIDARFQRLAPNHHIRIFKTGISGLSRMTGKEHDQICRVLLGVIVDMRLPSNLNSSRLIRAVRALLDFVYLARLPVHSNNSLSSLAKSLQDFHDNKSIFIDLGIREQFNIPKLHSCRHYSSSIKLFGTTDNYDSQYTERLHIELAKLAYRSTNQKDEFLQMMSWLERQEQVFRHNNFIEWHAKGNNASDVHSKPRPQLQPGRRLKMTKHPTMRAVSVDKLISTYGATFIRDALARFAAQWRNPQLNRPQVERQAAHINLPFVYVSTYHRIKFTLENGNATVDSIHVRPARKDKKGQNIPGRFDTVLVRIGAAEMEGRIDGMHNQSIYHISCILI